MTNEMTQPQPIETAPKDRRILAFMWGRWRVAQWDEGLSYKQPRPYWSASDLRINDSRLRQPKWWVELPPNPEA